MPRRRHGLWPQRLTSGEVGKPGLLVVGVAIGLLDRFHICLQKTMEGDRPTEDKSAELAVGGLCVDLDRYR